MDFPIFSIIPRLFILYYPSFKALMQNYGARARASKPEGSTRRLQAPSDSFEVESGAEELDRSDHNQLSSIHPIQSFECFMFQVSLMKHWSELEVDDTQDQMISYLRRKRKARETVKVSPDKAALKYNRSMRSSMFQRLSNLISKERGLLIDGVKDVMRTTVSVETHKYKDGQIFREVNIVGKQEAGRRVCKFFKLFAEDKSSSLLEILMISPESLNNLCRLCFT